MTRVWGYDVTIYSSIGKYYYVDKHAGQLTSAGKARDTFLLKFNSFGHFGPSVSNLFGEHCGRTSNISRKKDKSAGKLRLAFWHWEAIPVALWLWRPHSRPQGERHNGIIGLALNARKFCIIRLPSVGVKEGLGCVLFRAISGGKTRNLAHPWLQYSVE